MKIPTKTLRYEIFKSKMNLFDIFKSKIKPPEKLNLQKQKTKKRFKKRKVV